MANRKPPQKFPGIPQAARSTGVPHHHRSVQRAVQNRFPLYPWYGRVEDETDDAPGEEGTPKDID